MDLTAQSNSGLSATESSVAPALATPQGTTTPSLPSLTDNLRSQDSPKLPPINSTALEGEVSLDFDADPDLDILPPKAPKVEPVEVEPTIPDKPLDKPEPLTKAERQYTGNEEVDNVLKKLPNQTFNSYKEKLTEWHKAYQEQKESPKWLSGHPEAYKLSPEYQSSVDDLTNMEFEYEVVEEALVSCKEGRTIRLLKSYDEEGNPEFEDIPAQHGRHSAKTELTLQSYYANARSNLAKSSKTKQNFENNFKAKIQEEHNFIESSFKRIFKDIDPEKFTKQEAGYAALLVDAIPNSVTPDHARRIAHYAMVSNLRMAKSFEDYVKKNKTTALRPSAGPPGISSDTISLGADMFGDD